VLEIGSGPGRLAVKLAQAAPGTEIIEPSVILCEVHTSRPPGEKNG